MFSVVFLFVAVVALSQARPYNYPLTTGYGYSVGWSNSLNYVPGTSPLGK